MGREMASVRTSTPTTNAEVQHVIYIFGNWYDC
jgi:hypothetical protein